MKGSSFRSATGCALLLVATVGITGMAAAQETNSAYINAIAAKGNIWDIDRYLAVGGDPNFADATGQTPLMTAALVGDLGMATLLVEKGADVDGRANNGLTALHAAAFVGAADVAAYLIKAGADVNDQANRFGITPLHAAAEENRLDAIVALLAAGADVTKIQGSNYTAASMAGFRQHWDAMALLMKAGAVCQPEEIAGTWLYQKCMAFAG